MYGSKNILSIRSMDCQFQKILIDLTVEHELMMIKIEIDPHDSMIMNLKLHVATMTKKRNVILLEIGVLDPLDPYLCLNDTDISSILPAS